MVLAICILIKFFLVFIVNFGLLFVNTKITETKKKSYFDRDYTYCYVSPCCVFDIVLSFLYISVMVDVAHIYFPRGF